MKRKPDDGYIFYYTTYEYTRTTCHVIIIIIAIIVNILYTIKKYDVSLYIIISVHFFITFFNILLFRYLFDNARLLLGYRVNKVIKKAQRPLDMAMFVNI